MIGYTTNAFRTLAVGLFSFASIFLHVATECQGASIFIENPSFEDPTLPDHITNDNSTLSFEIPGWTIIGSVVGIYNPVDAHYTGASDQEPDSDTPIPDGKNVAFIDNSPGVGFFQDLGETLQINATYTLSAFFGDRLDRGGAGYDLKLFAGGSVVANVTGAAVNGEWIQDSVTAVIGESHSDAGQPLRIEIRRTANVQLNVDLVQLGFEPSGEPPSGPPFGPPFEAPPFGPPFGDAPGPPFGDPPFGPPQGEPPFGPPFGEPPFGGPPFAPHGDGNLNGEVEAADYTIWANGFGGTSPQFADGDYNVDGSVDTADYTIWANNFDQSILAAQSAASAIPEPSTLTLAGLGLLGLLAYGWRRRRRA